MRDGSSIGSPNFRSALPFITKSLVPAYADLGLLAFAYCQGSMVENLSDSSDIDTIFVWQEDVPAETQRPPVGLYDKAPEPRVWARQECFYVAGQEYGVAHHTVGEWDDWTNELNMGRGDRGYPTPVIAVHGLVSGLRVYDPHGSGLAMQQRFATFPEKLRVDPPQRARAAMAENIKVLEECARLEDGLLFHGELVRAARLLWIGWFSANERYWPLEKRLGGRLRLMGRDDLAALEEQVWTVGPDLHAKLLAFRILADRLLAEMPAS